MNYILRQLLPSGSKDKPIEIHLTEDEVCVGRRTKVMLSKFPQISRDHAIFYKSDNGNFFVKDNNSLNGIFVNDVKIGRSLKSLSVGDVIGFGVPSSVNAEGFVCTVCSDASYKVKHEVIDISDDDDDNPPQPDVINAFTSHNSQSVKEDEGSYKFPIPNGLAACSSKSSLPPLQNCAPSTDSLITNIKSVSRSSNTKDIITKAESGISEVPSADYLSNNSVPSDSKFSPPSDIPLVSNFNHDAVENLQFLNLPSTKKQQGTARKSISSLKRNISLGNKNSSNSSEFSSLSISNVNHNTVKNSPFPNLPSTTTQEDTARKSISSLKRSFVLCGKRSLDSPDSSLSDEDVKCHSRKISKTIAVSKSQSIPSLSRRKNKKAKEDNLVMTTRTCMVELIKCDSKYFPWPEDVKNPFSESHYSSSSKNNYRHFKEKTSSNCRTVESKPSTSKSYCSSIEQKNTKKYKSESESDNELNYSQVEDIIYISDDDEYLDFKSSQDYVHIKVEPEDHDEVDAGEEDEFDALSAVNNVDNFALTNQKNDNEEENGISLPAFVEKTQVDRMELEESDHDLDAEIEKNKYVTRHLHPFNSDEENNLNITEAKLYSKKNICDESNQNFVEEKLTVVESIRSRLKDTGKVQIIDAKPLDYRPRRMRGRDERVVERPKSVPISVKKRKISTKQQSAKEKNLSKSNLKNYKIPRKVTEVYTDSSAKEIKQDQKKDSVSREPLLAKKAPSVKTRPDKFASRMQFLTEELPVNPWRITPANDSSKKSVDNAAKMKQSSSVRKSIITSKTDQESNKSAPQNIPSTSVSYDKPVAPQKSREDLRNPRDPRQNRHPAPSSELLKPYSGAAVQTPITPLSLPVPKLSHSSNNYDVRHNQTFLPSNTQDRRLFHNQPKNFTSFELRNRLIKEILKLNTKWLQEQNKMKRPPDPVCEGAHNLPLKFDSFQSYVSAFYPMIRLELWEQMYTESKEVFESNKRYKKFYFSVLSYTSKDDYVELECESVVSEKVSFGPQEGSIVILEMKENTHKCSPMFGYIDKCRKSELDLKKLKYPHWGKLFEKSGIKDKMNTAKHWTFQAHIKKKEMSFELGSLMKGNGLCYIRNKLRLVDALSFLQHSPLVDNFLQPKWQTFLVKYNAACPVREFNSGQIELINGVSAEMCKPTDESKIMLLQGPPGTGKTHTIIGLIHKLLINNNYQPSFKILITAPSNAAIDEIACRLIAFNKNAKFEKHIKFTRVGLEEQVNPKVKQYLIDNMVRNSPGNSSWVVSNENDRQLRNLQAEIERLQNRMPSKHSNEKLSYLQEQYNRISSNASTRKMNVYSDMAQIEGVLKECHIVLSTLSSCGISLLMRTFKPPSKTQFSFCIIDESTQCTELEILQPLMLGVKKVLLVGDHKQLPATVRSQLACKYGFERSAFERFHSYFEKYCKKTPLFTLSEQFRMHSAICEFPSKYIYGQKLITNPNIDVRYEDFPLIPYMVLDVYVSQEKDDSSSKMNTTEAQVIINICTILLDLAQPASSIGIITPYQAQRSLYAGVLHKNPHYKDIEVNTVDGFQGREKDIIIVSSVRANSQGSIGFLACKRRLNVAITRARKCLIVCGHADSLMTDPDWRELILDARKRKVCFHVNTPEDIPFLHREYMRKKRSMLKS